MNIGKATSIFKDITSEEFTVSEKLQAIRKVLNMPTHNGISKEQILFTLDWLWNQHCMIEIEIVTEWDEQAMMSEEDKKLILEELQKDAEKDKKHAYGVWYPVSDPPECDMYGIALCVNGKRGNARYVHAVYQDNCNCYEEGKFWPGGTIDPNLTVDAWLKLPACPIDITASK